jgi:transcriptional regulator with XRE-family HTH domain
MHHEMGSRMPASLGTFIRERRQDLGLTQEQLAERLGDTVRQAEISRLEKDRILLPRRERLTAIAAALEVSLGELLVRTGWMQEGDGLAEAILELPRAGWGAADLEALRSADPEALVAALTRAEALIAEAAEGLVQAEQALASLRQLLRNVHNQRGEVRPKIGVMDDWETAAICYAA